MAWQPQAVFPGGFTDEAMLVAALRGGQHEAFEALHESFAAPIYNLALRIVEDREEARDVAQEVLIKAYRGLPSEAPDLSLTPWLYRVTVNAAFDHVRARGRRPRAVCADEQQPQMAAPVDEFEQSELARRVEQTLRALPKRQQVALLLRDVHGLSVGETADALGLTRGSADVLLSRARSTFRRVFTAGAGAVAGRCTVAADAVAGGVGGGGGSSGRRRDAVLAHARSCPECRKTVDLWAAAPLGLGVVLPQLAAPAALSTAGTVAAAAATAAGEGAAGAVLGGLLAKLGALAGVKVATVAAVVAVAAGTAGVATYEVKRDADHPSDRAVAAQTAPGHGAAGAPAAGRAGTRDAWAQGREGVRLRAAAHGRQAMRSPDGRARGAHAANGGHTGGGMSGSGGAGMSGSGGAGMSGSGGSGGMSGSGGGAGMSGSGGSGGMSGSGGSGGMSGSGGSGGSGG